MLAQINAVPKKPAAAPATTKNLYERIACKIDEAEKLN